MVFSSEGDSDLKLDLYLPLSDDETSNFPVIVWIHGSDWRGELWCEGGREPCPAAYLTDHGYAVASIEYRLATDEPFPAQLIDAIAALQWIVDNAKEYHLDSKNIGLWGVSGGGLIAALLGTTSGRGEINFNGVKLAQSVNVKAVVDCFGPIDVTQWDALHRAECHEKRISQYLDNSPLSLLLGGMPSEMKSLAELLNPITYISEKTSPFLIFHGVDDSVVPMGHSGLLHRALIEAGAISNLKIRDDVGHGLEALNAWGEIQNFFDEYLKGISDDEELCDQNAVYVNKSGGIYFDSYVDPISRATGGTQYKTFKSKTINDDISYLIYLPPSYNKNKTSRYPVIYWLHDKEQGPRDNLYYAYIFDEAIKANEVSDVIIVLVNGRPNSGYRDSEENGPMESIIINDLIPHIDQNYPTLDDRDFRAVEGVGMGGEGAGRFGFKYPKLFGYVSIIGLRMEDRLNHNGDRIEDWVIKNHDLIADHTRIRIVDFGDDHSNSEKFPLHHIMETNNITHDWVFVERSKQDFLNSFLSADFNLVEFYHSGDFQRKNY